MFFHASQVGGLCVLKPHVSNHERPLLYLSAKRENVPVYLSNAVEKYCRETGFAHNGKWHTWASYGFDTDGILRLDEYYPDAVRDTYKGISGYIYSAEVDVQTAIDIGIPDAVAVAQPVSVSDVEYIEDAYCELLKAEREGLIRIRRYEQHSKQMMSWIETTIRKEYMQAETAPDYRHFLRAKFSFIKRTELKK